jgi:shikimate kinase
MKLYLIGLPGSGKSFLGKQLADEMKLPFIDLDAVIERETQTTIAQLFSEKGEDYFRSLEATALRQQSKESGFVMACGGGTPCFHNNLNFINETGKSIFINTPVKEIVKRLCVAERQNRPLLAESTPEALEDKLNALLEKRLPFYNSATFKIAGNLSLAEILDQIRK